tara:strand:+ start:132664 stop:133719 length:1056 start_codon:yes stop_codon:yes gene_type:complete
MNGEELFALHFTGATKEITESYEEAYARLETDLLSQINNDPSVFDGISPSLKEYRPFVLKALESHFAVFDKLSDNVRTYLDSKFNGLVIAVQLCYRGMITVRKMCSGLDRIAERFKGLNNVEYYMRTLLDSSVDVYPYLSDRLQSNRGIIERAFALEKRCIQYLPVELLENDDRFFCRLHDADIPPVIPRAMAAIFTRPIALPPIATIIPTHSDDDITESEYESGSESEVGSGSESEVESETESRNQINLMRASIQLNLIFPQNSDRFEFTRDQEGVNARLALFKNCRPAILEGIRRFGASYFDHASDDLKNNVEFIRLAYDMNRDVLEHVPDDRIVEQIREEREPNVFIL